MARDTGQPWHTQWCAHGTPHGTTHRTSHRQSHDIHPGVYCTCVLPWHSPMDSTFTMWPTMGNSVEHSVGRAMGDHGIDIVFLRWTVTWRSFSENVQLTAAQWPTADRVEVRFLRGSVSWVEE